MKIISFVSAIVLIVTTTGCSWLGFRDRTNDYLLANEIERVKNQGIHEREKTRF